MLYALYLAIASHSPRVVSGVGWREASERFLAWGIRQRRDVLSVCEIHKSKKLVASLSSIGSSQSNGDGIPLQNKELQGLKNSWLPKKSQQGVKARIRTKKRCSHKGCTTYAQKRGVCITHGSKVTYKQCSHKGCTNQEAVTKGGVCVTHGATVKQCTFIDTFKKQAQKGGVCITHGRAKHKQCSFEGCTNNAKKGGVVSQPHGATRKEEFVSHTVLK